ncbi:uncharacterized protein LOC130630629 [Hydractinia symbiolongicarpus]|uniref:uncharacterized protein LOC130630629 n=1 Tax=Hydractinia symbiolongicarpus TaxID=13093 RepID=UPI002549F888|nr:uncharacterized protein LOC130630629 [Hydractinia symbiolongicarpus]
MTKIMWLPICLVCFLQVTFTKTTHPDWKCYFADDWKYINLVVEIDKIKSNVSDTDDLTLQFRDYASVPYINGTRCSSQITNTHYQLDCSIQETANLAREFESPLFRVINKQNIEVWHSDNRLNLNSELCKCKNCHRIKDFRIVELDETIIKIAWRKSTWDEDFVYNVTVTNLKNESQIIRVPVKGSSNKYKKTIFNLLPCTAYKICLEPDDDNTKNARQCVQNSTLCGTVILDNINNMTIEVKMTLATLAGLIVASLSIIIFLKCKVQHKTNMKVVLPRKELENTNDCIVSQSELLEHTFDHDYEEVSKHYQEIHKSKELVIDDDIDEVFVDTNDDYVYASNVSEVDWYSDTYTDDYTMDETYSAERIKSFP